MLGLLLAAVGLYGVTAHAVTSRRAEIGIRMALGASANGVVSMVLRRVAWLVGVGIALGAALSPWAAKFIGTLLYGLDARDPVTFAGRGRAPRRRRRAGRVAARAARVAGSIRCECSETRRAQARVGAARKPPTEARRRRFTNRPYPVRSAIDGSTRAARRAGR